MHIAPKPHLVFTEPELEEFVRAFSTIAELIAKLGKDIRTPREMAFLQLGLRASHIEESLMIGDHERAQAHLTRAVDILRRMR